MAKDLDLSEFGGTPQLDLSEFQKEPEKPRTWGEAAKDTGAALMQGGAGLVKSAGDLYGLASGDMNNAVSQLGQSGQEYWEEAKSGALRRKIAKRKEDIDASPSTLGKAWAAVKETVTDPALAMDTVAGNAATMLPGMAAGRLAAGAKMAAGMKAAQEFGPVALGTQSTIASQAARVGTGVAVGAGAAQQGADVSGNIYGDLMKKPDATWDANPDFAQAVARNGGDREAAKRELATQTARAAFVPAAGISAVANAFPGATMLEKSLIGGAARDTIKEGTKYAIPKAIAKGMVGEGTQEFVEEGGGRLAANIAAQKIADPSHDTWDQVGENAGMGLAGGLLMGAGGGAFHRQAHTNQPTPPEQPPQPPSDQSTGVGAGMGGTEPFVPPAFTTNPQPTTLGTQTTATAGPGFDANSVLPKVDPVRDMVQQAADAGGSISAAALVGIDSGAHETQLQAALLDEKVQAASKDMPADVADAWAQYRAESAALQNQPGDWATQAADEERQQGPLQIPPKGMNMEQRKANLAKRKERMLAGRSNGTSNAVQSLPTTGSGIDGNQQSASMGLGNADGNGLGADAGGYSAHPVVQSGEQPTAEPSVETTEKSKNLARLKEKLMAGRPQFQSNPQPTTLGTQTTAKAGPGFDASYLPQGTRNVSQASQAVTSSPQQQEAGNQAPVGAATTTTQPGTAGGSDVQATGVEVSQPAQPAANAGEGAGASQPGRVQNTPGSDAGNGFKQGPVSGERYRVGVIDSVGGAVALEKRLPAGTHATFYIGKDGGLIDGDSIDLSRQSSRDGLWIPSDKAQADSAIAILDEMGKLSLDDPKRKEAKDRLKAVVLGVENTQPTQAAKPKKPSLKQRMEAERKARADYFTPGNIVKGYSGYDRVIDYKAPDEKGDGWSVTVQSVVKQGNEWVVDPKDSRVRTHATHPDAKEMKNGPVYRAQSEQKTPSDESTGDQEQVNKQVSEQKAPANTEPEAKADTLDTANMAKPQAGGNTQAENEEPAKYELPDKVSTDWNGTAGNPNAERTPRQKMLMASVAKALDAGKHYNNEVREFVADDIGATGDTLTRNHSNVEDGDFGYDVYLARKAVEAQRNAEKAKKVSDELSLKAGDELGTLIFNDFKVTTGVKVESVSDDGKTVKFTGKRGRFTLTGEGTPFNIKSAIERATEQGKRKDGYESFVAGRNKSIVQEQKPATVKVPQTVSDAISAQMQKQKGRITRLRNEAEKAGSLEDKKAAQAKVTAAETTLRKMRTGIFDAEDAAVKAVESGNAKEFDQFADLFPGAAEEIAKLTGQKDELDAEMRSYEAKYPDENPKAERKPKAKKQQTRRVYNEDGSYYDAPVEDAQSSSKAAEKAALSEREKAAKAKMYNALGKLAALATKNTRMNWTAEEEQQLLPIVIELFDGAVELGAVTFQQAVAYVRDFIAQGIDQETADSIPFETLQGAYIAMSGRHKDKGVTPRKEVVAFDSLAELEKSAPYADTLAKDQANEPTNTGSENPQALGDLAAEQNGGVEGKRRVGRGRGGRSAGSVSDDSGLTEPRVSGTRSGGSGSTSVRAPKPGGTGRGRRTGAGTEGNGSQLPAERGTVPVEDDIFSDKPASEPVSASNIQATNFRITPDLRLGQGGESEKFRDNLAAIRTLKAIEAEGRRATSEEQRILARYVGWGGLANAFPSPETKEWKDDWKARGAELKDLLTAKEYDLARRSTLDSHYTSQTVVSAMWDAAKRLGFSGGMAAETSMGIGNFMGLMPEGIAGNTRFIGVEYDSLTARMAALLYPQATVLHSGLQKVPLPDSVFDLNIGNPPFGDQSLRFQFKPEFNRVSIHNQFFLAGIDSLKPGGLQLNVVSRYLLDAMDKTTRTMLAKKAKLVAAIRLPDTAFKENARTSVVTDIVMLQRLTPGEQAEMEAAFQAAASKPEKDREKEAERRALAALVPEWVEVTKMRDPLGGDPMTVNSYFAKNPGMILGTLERSGKMQFKNDITVRPSDRDLGEMLAEAVAKLPEGIANTSQDAVAASLERYTSLSDALKIALSGQEAGSIAFNQDGQMEQVYERETPEGDYELTKRVLTESSPWSESLYQDSKGNWFSIEAKLDEDGNKLKVMKDGKPTKANVYDRKMYASESEIPAGMRLGEKRLARLQKMVKLRDLMVNQINLETEDAPPIRMEGNRQKLAKAYRDFVESEGFISRQANASLVANMPDGALVQALELSYRKEITKDQAKKLGENPRPEQADPAPILSERVIPKYEPPTKAASAADALSITMSESGRVDIERIASLLGKSEEEVIAEMFDKADKPLIFKDPETQQWVTRNDYLTGQVKKKLHAAQAAGLDKHVKELEAVQPEPWGAENVTVLLGSTFVPPQVYADFIQHVTGMPAKVSFQQATNSYAVQANGATQEKQDEWGAEGVSIGSMVSDMLNSTSIKVMTKNADNNLVFNKELTDLAQLKARQIASEFTDWAFANGDRRKLLVDLFNEKYNTRVTRQHDGSHLTLPGKVPDAILRMRRHQKNAIWRGISERFMLIDHAVGAGKTFTAIARAMERRRMGLSRKPAIVVPNHMVEQFTADVYRLYPGAKVLAAGGKDFEKKKRRKLFAKIASGDWDIVIIPHSSFGFIGIAPETEERYLEKELALAEQAIKDAWEESEQAESSFRKPFNVKTAERLRDKITARMDSVRGNMNKDRLLTFEQMGIDDLTVDEAHEFKNLFYSTRLKDVKGMGNQSGSEKAFDLYNKVRVLRESPTGTVTFMTGTPISNSAVEMFTMMRYLAADELNELGLEHFDAWRAQFVSADPGWEPTETGRLKEVTRLGRSWSNMRSLMDLYYSFTDSVSNDDIKKAYAEDNNGAKFPIPSVKGGDRRSVVIQPTDDQAQLLTDTMAAFDSLPDIEDPYERNKERLRLMDRARKISLDVRAAVAGHPGKEKGGKLDKIAEEVKRIYTKFDADKGTQLVFLDRSVPKSKGDDKEIKEYDELIAKRNKALLEDNEAELRRVSESLERFDPNEIAELRAAQAGGWNAYQQIKDNLIAQGIPAKEIRFVQEATNDAQKQALFDAVNAGEVRVLIGSTPRMGAGTNVQQRLVGLHHADVTWKPSDIEQREGRIIRQGNKLLDKYGIDNFEVEILAYATERTIDSKMWSLNSAKLKTINAIRNYDGSFSMDFDDNDSVSMAEMAALASGNPLLLERVKLDSDINNLEILRKQHQRKTWGYKSRMEDAENDIRNAKPRQALNTTRAAQAKIGADELAADLKTRSVTVEGQTYTNHSDAVKAAEESRKAQQGGDEEAKFSIKIGESRVTSMNGAFDKVYAALGDDSPFLAKVAGKEYRTRTDLAREVAKLATEAGPDMVDGETKLLATGQMLGFTFEANMSRGSYRGYEVDFSLVDADGRTVTSTISRPQQDSKIVTSMLSKPLADLDRGISPGYFESEARFAVQRAEKAEKELPDLRTKANMPFAKEAELAEKRARLAKVIAALAGNGAATNLDYPPGRYLVTNDKGEVEKAPRYLSEDDIDQLFRHGWTMAPVDPLANTKQTGEFAGNDTDVVFSRVKFSRTAQGQANGTVEKTVADIVKGWATRPKIVVAFDMNDERIPERVRMEDQKQRSGGASGSPEGFYYKGTVYLMSSKLATPEDVARVLFHEALGHHGLRSVFGKKLNSILNRIAMARKSEVDAKMAQYGLKGISKVDRLTAAEEILAEMAQTKPNIGFVREAIAAIRTWLRDHIPGFKNLALTDDEIIRSYIVPARNFVERGGTQSFGMFAPSMARDASQRESDVSPIGFYSALARGIEASTANIAPALGWKATIKGLVNKGLAKADEVEWSGVNDWLDMQGGKVTKQQVMDFLRGNGVQVQEVVLGTEKSKPEDELTASDISVKENEYDWDISTPSGASVGVGRYTVTTEQEAREYGARYFNGQIRERNREQAKRGDGTKYGQYTLPGGENYREVLLTLPSNAADVAGLSPGEAAPILFAGRPLSNLNDVERKQVMEAIRRSGSAKATYRSSHWDQPNVLAHIRLNDRTDAEGARVLFVEEVQSDWGQDGKKKGFIEKEPTFTAVRKGNWYPGDSSIGKYEVFADGVSRGFFKAGNEEYAIAEAKGSMRDMSNRVPVAPFVTKTEGWLNLALKRIIKMAVDGGYDKVAFVNGQQSTDRYWSEPVIVGAVGRWNDVTKPERGMKAFYDQIVPNAVKKLVGKLGGEHGAVQVDRTEFGKRGKPVDWNPAYGVTSSQPGFTITEAMREKVAGGLPLFSRTAAIKKAGDVLNESFNYPGTVSKWHTTVGSMYNLAERNQDFKQVFNATQDFLNDVSYYATEAADMAPKIMPKLETLKDLVTKQPISYEDNKAIAAPIFQGTLSWARDVNGRPVLTDDLKARAADMTAEQKAQDMLRAGKLDPNILRMWQGMEQDHYEAAVNSRYENVMLKPGVVWTDAELKSIFKLNDAQVGLYHEFRNAINTSIDNAAKASMLRTAGKDVQAMRDMVMDAPTAEIAGLTLRDHLQGMAQDNPDRSDELIAMANEMMDQADKAETLKKEGYAPLSRFGHYTVDVVVNGERKYFSMFESKKEANRVANLMRQEYGAGNVAQATMSEREFEQFQGITPESMELFGNMLGLDPTGNEAQDKAFQTYLRKTKANRSAMKRLIHRKGISGYSEDVGRVLAAFVYSNARQTAGALNLGKLSEAVNKTQGELKDVAIGLQQYVTKPQEEAQAIRGMMFAQYLGGSIASALVNLTQPMAISFPYLSQYGAGKAAKALTKAYADMKGGDRSLEGGLQKALKIAEEQGIVAPQEVHQLMAQAQGKASLHGGDGTKLGNFMAKSGNAFTKLALGWGKLFGWAEQINRKATFIAAYRMAAERGDSNPFDFAKKAVNETQFINNRGNKMQWGRGAIGATLMTFKSYSINYLELLHRMATRNGPEGKKAAAIMLGMLLLMAGAGGLPFADDLNDLLDFFAERMGYNFSTKKAKQEFLEGLFGKAMADFIDRGITGLPGSPIDVSGRMSMANLLPGTGLLLEKRDHSRDAQELLGPVGDMAKRAFDGANAVLDGDIKKALLSVAPKAISNAAQGFDMSQKGYYADTKGYKVLSTTPGEAIAKAIGFQPQSVSMVQESNAITQRMKDTYALHAEKIRSEWAKGVFEHDPDQIQKARDMLKEWNDKNPDQRIIVRIPDVMKKARDMAKDKEQRIADTAPKAMRAHLKQEILQRKAMQ